MIPDRTDCCCEGFRDPAPGWTSAGDGQLGSRDTGEVGLARGVPVVVVVVVVPVSDVLSLAGTVSHRQGKQAGRGSRKGGRKKRKKTAGRKRKKEVSEKGESREETSTKEEVRGKDGKRMAGCGLAEGKAM